MTDLIEKLVSMRAPNVSEDSIRQNIADILNQGFQLIETPDGELLFIKKTTPDPRDGVILQVERK